MNISSFTTRSLIPNLYLAHRAMHELLSESLGASGLTYSQSLILAALYFEKGKLDVGPSRLAKSLEISRARISQELTKLEQQGFIARGIGSVDSRSFTVRLLAKGEKKAEAAIKALDSVQTRVDEILGERASENVAGALKRLSTGLGAR